MKKKQISIFLLSVMLICLSIGLSAGAYADNSTSLTISTATNWQFDTSTVGNVTALSVASGKLPSGMSLTYSGTASILSGTPTEAGAFDATVQITTDTSASYIVNITVKVTDGKPAITKNPTGETVDEGGSAKFISRADNCKAFVWRLVSADTTNTVPAADAADYFKGLKVEGTDTDTLVLSNIPASLNGWAVECKFTGNDGSLLYSNGAVIHVNSAKPASPKISNQPAAATAEIGSGVTLSVTASAETGCTLTYQWYSCDENSKDNLKAVSGAVSASFTPPQTEGTLYYCVDVFASKDGVKSDAVRSSLVEVTYTKAPESTPSAAPEPAPVQTAPPAESAAPASDESSGTAGGDNSGSSSGEKSGSVKKSTPWFIFVIIGVGVIVVCVGTAIIVTATGKGKYDDEVIRCPSCGWESDPDESTPYFCPNCGRPFGDNAQSKNTKK